MTLRQRLLGGFIVLILLLPTVFFPFGEDHFVFLRGGQVLLNGGLIYVDYYDVKPPLIFYIYSAAAWLFGPTESGVRIFDFLWQGVTVWSLYWVVKRLTTKEMMAFIAAGAYSATYTTLNVPMTMQCESYAAIALIWIIYIQVADSGSRWQSVLQGAAMAFATALKYPLGIIVPALLLYQVLYARASWRERCRSWLTLGGAYLLCLAIFLLPFFNHEVLAGYRRISEYLLFYASNPPLSMAFIRDALKHITAYFGDNFSFALLTCVGGAYLSLIDDNNRDRTDNHTRLLGLLTIMLISLLLAVIIERKFMPYHFSRMYGPLSILVGLGAGTVFEKLRSAYRDEMPLRRVVAMACTAVLLVWSPLPRWLATLAPMINTLTNHPEATDERMQRANAIATPRKDIREIAAFIHAQPEKHGKTIALSMIATELYYFLGEKDFSKFIGTTLLYSVSPVRGMKEELLAEVKQAQWLILQKNDYYPLLFGHVHSSAEMALADPMTVGVLQQFTKMKTIGEFDIYRRTTPLTEH